MAKSPQQRKHDKRFIDLLNGATSMIRPEESSSQKSAVSLKRPKKAQQPSAQITLETLAQMTSMPRVEDSPLLYVSPDRLHRGRFQPRRTLNDHTLNELAASIQELGILEPLIVRPLDAIGQDYEILAGERRWRAAQQVGLEHIPMLIRPVDDRTAAAIALVENLQREDLNPLEAARALQSLMRHFSLSQAQVGVLIGQSESAISKALGLLKLPESVQQLLEKGRLDAGHAKVLLNLPAPQQQALAERAVALGWSVRELERQRQQLSLKSRRLASRSKNAPDPDLHHLEVRLQEWLCASVRLKANRQGGGTIEIDYASLAECEGILERIGFRFDE